VGTVTYHRFGNRLRPLDERGEDNGTDSGVKLRPIAFRELSMQEITPQSSTPTRLTCGGCRHWEETSIRTVPAGESVGRCDRFSETRSITARPRCNICWEPRVTVLRPIEAAQENG
jgi:hypothetical protein